MQNNDVELIHRILDGDDAAFTELVTKYQRSVHALAWRKIGDFHIAEEITQDTFLKAYQKLSTLKESQSFASWLYVIAVNRCKAWLRRKRIRTQSLEDTHNAELERATYSSYVIKEKERAAVETQQEVVKKLLAKLPESDRTIITLHYFSEMSSSEIGAFLGVSANTIRSRLRRAQQRLQKEETMIREALEHFKLSPNLTDNIMHEIARFKPAAPTGGKPMVPWIVAATSAVLIVLMLGLGSQNLVRLQQPYSLDAQAETAIELVDAPIGLNVDMESDERNQLGNSNALDISENNGQKPDEVLLAAAETEGENVSVPKQQWIQSEPVKGSGVHNLHLTPEGELYLLSNNKSIYKLSANGNNWLHVYDTNLLDIRAWLGDEIAMWNNTLYYVPSDQLFAINVDDKSSDLIYSWDSTELGSLVELLLTDDSFYIAFMNGVLRSDDRGRTWEEISEGLIGGIRSLAMIQNTLFVGTENGLYRLIGDIWHHVEFAAPVGRIRSIAVTDDTLYVAADINQRVVPLEEWYTWWVFRSTDLGNSWRNITPTNAWSEEKLVPFVKLIAVDETLLISWLNVGLVRSTDSGDGWMPVQEPGTYPPIIPISDAVALDEQTFYVASSDDGLHRSIDGGKSWHAINIDRKSKTRMDNLIVLKETEEMKDSPTVVYAKVGREIAKTIDMGKFWNIVQMEKPKSLRGTVERPFITQIVKSGDNIYAKGGDSYGDGSRYSSGDGITRLYHISADDNTLRRVQNIPIFDAKPLRFHLSGKTTNTFESPEIEEKFIKRIQNSTAGATQFFKQVAKWDPKQPDFYMKSGFHGPFAVSEDTFYLEYNFKLFRWKKGDREWTDTGVEETAELTLDVALKDLKLAVSGETVYVGKRDGTLLQSFDGGINWKTVPMNLSFSIPVKVFKDIVFVDNNIYVATDAGIITSDDGRNWHPLTDAEKTNLIMERLAVDDKTLYGATNESGIYCLENGTWEQIVSEIPDNITSLAVHGNTFYVGTPDRGMLHFTLEK